MKSQGFTLIELLVVVGLLAIMASMAVLSLDSTRADAETDATKFEMAEIRKALLQFRYDVRHFPDAEALIAASDRIALLSSCQATDSSKIDDAHGISYDEGCTAWDADLKRGWNGPYLSAGGGDDAWGNAYRLLEPDSDTPGSGTARIVSNGQDGAADSADDIVVFLVQ